MKPNVIWDVYMESVKAALVGDGRNLRGMECKHDSCIEHVAIGSF